MLIAQGRRSLCTSSNKLRDARVELLRRQIVRRILHRSLARGWTSWVELWQARVFALDWLRRAGNTFRRTDVSRSFYRWREEWQELHHKRSLATRDAAAESITAVLCRQFTKKLLRQEIARAWAYGVNCVGLDITPTVC